MGERDPDPPATLGDIMLAVFLISIVVMVFSIMDSYNENRHYHDLRDRLERLERR